MRALMGVVGEVANEISDEILDEKAEEAEAAEEDDQPEQAEPAEEAEEAEEDDQPEQAEPAEEAEEPAEEQAEAAEPAEAGGGGGGAGRAGRGGGGGRGGGRAGRGRGRGGGRAGQPNLLQTASKAGQNAAIKALAGEVCSAAVAAGELFVAAELAPLLIAGTCAAAPIIAAGGAVLCYQTFFSGPGVSRKSSLKIAQRVLLMKTKPLTGNWKPLRAEKWYKKAYGTHANDAAESSTRLTFTAIESGGDLGAVASGRIGDMEVVSMHVKEQTSQGNSGKYDLFAFLRKGNKFTACRGDLEVLNDGTCKIEFRTLDNKDYQTEWWMPEDQFDFLKGKWLPVMLEKWEPAKHLALGRQQGTYMEWDSHKTEAGHQVKCKEGQLGDMPISRAMARPDEKGAVDAFNIDMDLQVGAAKQVKTVTKRVELQDDGTLEITAGGFPSYSHVEYWVHEANQKSLLKSLEGEWIPDLKDKWASTTAGGRIIGPKTTRDESADHQKTRIVFDSEGNGDVSVGEQILKVKASLSGRLNDFSLTVDGGKDTKGSFKLEGDGPSFCMSLDLGGLGKKEWYWSNPALTGVATRPMTEAIIAGEESVIM
jgi:hypothetical protein